MATGSETELTERAVAHPSGRAAKNARSDRARSCAWSITLYDMPLTALAPDSGSVQLDPLAPSPRGSWSAHGVRVRRRAGAHRSHDASNSVCTPRFCVTRNGETLTVEHDLGPDELSDELAVLLADELVDSGALRGRPEFEMVFTGVVRSTVDGGVASWSRFYRNSLHELEHGDAAFAPVHHRATELVEGNRLIDLGSCFGFFPLRVAMSGIDVLATDLSVATMDLLARMSARLNRPLRTMTCDATAVPLPDYSADSVTVLHLLEHLSGPAGHTVLTEALRLARRRVVVAVPFEQAPRECYGHVQCFDLDSLGRLGTQLCAEHPGVTAAVSEFHGGWLVLDR